MIILIVHELFFGDRNKDVLQSWKSDENNVRDEKKKSDTKKVKYIYSSDGLSVYFAMIFYLVFGALITIGGLMWLTKYIRNVSTTTNAGYALLVLSFFLISEIQALLVHIPSIKGYDELGTIKIQVARVLTGVFFVVLLVGLWVWFIIEQPKYGILHQLLARNYYRVSTLIWPENELKLDQINELLKYNEDNAEYYYERGNIYLDLAQNKTNEAEEIYNSIDLSNYSSQDYYDLASKDYENAIEKDKNVADYHFKYAIAISEKGAQYAENAKDHFEEAINLDGNNPEYYYYSSKIWYYIGKNDIGEYEEVVDIAFDRIKEAIRLYEKNDKSAEYKIRHNRYDDVLASYYYQKGRVLLLQEETEKYDSNNEALEENVSDALEIAVKLNNKNALYHSELGRELYKIGSEAAINNALEEFDRAIEIDKLNSDYDDASVQYAWKAYVINIVDENNEHFEDVELNYKKAIDYSPSYDYPYDNLGELYYMNGKYTEAIDLYTRAISDCTTVPHGKFYYKRGLIFYNLKNYEMAISDIRIAISLDRSYSRDGHWNIAMSYYDNGQFQNAIEEFNLAKDHGIDEMIVEPWVELCKRKLGESSSIVLEDFYEEAPNIDELR